MGVQRLRDEHAVPHMAPWTMAKVMAQTSNFNAQDIAIGDSQLRLLLLKVRRHSSCKVRNTCQRRGKL